MKRKEQARNKYTYKNPQKIKSKNRNFNTIIHYNTLFKSVANDSTIKKDAQNFLAENTPSNVDNFLANLGKLKRKTKFTKDYSNQRRKIRIEST